MKSISSPKRITAWYNFFFLGQHWIIINNKLVNKAKRWQSPDTSANWTLSRDYEGADRPEFKNTYSCKLKSYRKLTEAEEAIAIIGKASDKVRKAFDGILTANLTGQGKPDLLIDFSDWYVKNREGNLAFELSLLQLEKSRVEVSQMEQDTIENVFVAYKKN